MVATDIAIITVEVIICGTDVVRKTTAVIIITSANFIDGDDGDGDRAELMYMMVTMLVTNRTMVITVMISIAWKSTMRTMRRTIVATISTMLPTMIGRESEFMTIRMTMGLRLRSRG